MRFTLTCKEAHRLTSERLDRKLSVVEHARRQWHLLICAACRNFDRQMRLIRRAMRQLSAPEDAGRERDST
jgi:predicted anti-sigma-YlaC factor YlaD